MRAWRQHWNHQLYKALEHQYQMGLEALNKNLPEIQIELTFKSVHTLSFVQLSVSLFVSLLFVPSLSYLQQLAAAFDCLFPLAYYALTLGCVSFFLSHWKILLMSECTFLFCCPSNRHGRLQFRPPFEEVRARYFREMKRFISIPNQFKGVSAQGEEPIFSTMIDRNASGFLTIFSKAEDLFSRLQAIQHKFKVPEQQMIWTLIITMMRLVIREVWQKFFF